MQDTIHEALVDAAERAESEVSLTPALSVISELADIDDSRHVLSSCIEQVTMADGSVVDVLEAEQVYRDWRAGHGEIARGTAVTGVALAEEMTATMEMLHNPSMESDLLQAMKRTFGSLQMAVKTFGKNLVDIRSRIAQSKDSITANPVLIESASAYVFLTRDNKPVTDLPTSLTEDIRFIDTLEKHYKTLADRSTEFGKRFREACNSDSDDNIREAIDYFDDNLLDRSEFEDLTTFNLLGNRIVYLDKRGFPQFKKGETGWKFTTKPDDVNNLVTKLAKKTIHGFSIGGPVKAVAGVAGVNAVLATKQVAAQVKSTGGETDITEFMKCMDQALALNNRIVKFAQMAAAMSEKITRLTGDMDDAYDHVNNEKTVTENAVRLRELRGLYRSARRSVSQYMFLGKAMATMMEDHATYVYRNITLIANEVLKKTVKEETP